MQRSDDSLENQVIDGVLVAVRGFSLEVDLPPDLNERSGIGFGVKVKMRDRGLGGQKTLCDDTPEAGKLTR